MKSRISPSCSVVWPKREGDPVYCSKCGNEMAASATFCSACGQAIGNAAPVKLSPVAIEQEYALPQPAPYRGVFYAGFWLRFVAHLIDSLVAGVMFLLLVVLLFV